MKVTRVPWPDRAPGDVGCLHGEGVISDPIAIGERLAGEIKPGDVSYTHCFVMANGATLEAIFPKISLSPWTVYDGKLTALFRIDADPAIKQAALLEIIHEYVGRGYDVTGTVLGMAGIEILRQFHLPAENNLFADKHREWCSELATRYIAKLLPDTENPTTTTPQQVFNYLDGMVGDG